MFLPETKYFSPLASAETDCKVAACLFASVSVGERVSASVICHVCERARRCGERAGLWFWFFSLSLLKLRAKVSTCTSPPAVTQTLTAPSCVSPQPAPQPVGEPHCGAAHDADAVLPGPQPQRRHPPQQQRLPWVLQPRPPPPPLSAASPGMLAWFPTVIPFPGILPKTSVRNTSGVSKM